MILGRHRQEVDPNTYRFHFDLAQIFKMIDHVCLLILNGQSLSSRNIQIGFPLEILIGQ